MYEMKESGYEWIGKIPSEWSINKGKYLYKIATGVLDVNAEDENGEYPFFTCSMYPKRIDKYMFDCEALLVAGNGLVGFTQYYNGKFNAYQRTYVLSEFKNINPQFLKHFTMTMLAKEVNPKKTGSVIQFIKLGDLQDFHVCIPSVEEQKKIANFLDAKSVEINELIKNVQDEIDTLESYKQSILFETVSKGIRAKKMQLVDSDIWNKIPENWKLRDIKYLFEIVKRIAGKEGFDILSVTQKGLKIKDISNNEGQIANNYSGYQLVYPTDYVMNHMDLLTGWVDCSESFGVTSPDYRVFRLIDKTSNNLQYYKYVMQCCYLCKIFYSLGQGVSNLGRWRLQTSTFLNFKVPVPPLEEQKEIAKYLNSKLSEIEITIETKKEQVSLLEEYRNSLIFEYTTGKKEVLVNG